jgi:hypothetical protein
MVTAHDRIGGAYHIMRSKYCGLLCGANVRLQLSFCNAIVTSTALYAGELWGCHPRTRAKRKRTAQKHCKYLRSFLRLSPSTRTDLQRTRERERERERLIPTSGRNDQSRADPRVTNGPEAKSNRNQRLKRSVRLKTSYDHTLGAFSK